MQTRTTWTEKLKFRAESDGNSVELDAKSPVGSGMGLTPKELLAIAVSGCTGMDVVALMRKYKQPLESFEVLADATVTEGVYPAVFNKIDLTFFLKGKLDKEKVIEAVRLSQTKFCGVSAMVVKAVPIHYKIILNDEEISTGEAAF